MIKISIYTVYILGAAVFWGTTGIFSKYLTGAGFSTDEVVVFRMLGAALYMGITLLVKDRSLFRIKLKNLPVLIAMGLVSIFGASFCYLRAIEESSIATAAILMYTAPFFVVLVSVPLYKEKLTAKKVIALLIAFVGCLLVSGLGKTSTLGIVYGLLAGITYATYSIFGKYALSKMDSLTVTFYGFSFAAITALCVTDPLSTVGRISSHGLPILLLVLGTGLFTSFMPYMLYTLGLKGTEAGAASVMSTLEPLMAALFAAIVFGQIPSISAIIGILLIFFAVVLINLKPNTTYKIVASDLDGTLFNKSAKVSDENWKAIETLGKMGVHFVPSSGRAFNEMPSFLKESPLIRYYINSDGGMIYDKKTDTTYELSMPKPVSHQVLDKLYQYPMCMMLHADVNSYVDADTHNDADYIRFNMDESWRTFTYAKNVARENFKEFAYSLDNIQMLCVFFENLSDLEECKEYFGNHPDLLVAQSYKYNLEIFHKTAGKGNAVAYLADILGIDRKATIAVGDSTNDYTMVQSAGLGLAMENAVDELKAVADEVICNNEQHSAKYILDHYIK